MWEPRRLTTIWAFTACCRDRFFLSMRNYVVFEVLTAEVTESSIFRDIRPCSLLKVNRRLLFMPPAFKLDPCSVYSSTLKMEAICSSETSVGFQRTTRRYIPEDNTLSNHRCESLKSYMITVCSSFCIVLRVMLCRHLKKTVL
jgi:hypothetical protein